MERPGAFKPTSRWRRIELKPPLVQSRQANFRAVRDESTITEELRRLQDQFETFKLSSAQKAKTKTKPPPRSTRSVQGKRRAPTCYNCTMVGHIEKYCPFPEEVVSKWLEDGLISQPKNRQGGHQPERTRSQLPKGIFSNFTPQSQGNTFGVSPRGPTTPQ